MVSLQVRGADKLERIAKAVKETQPEVRKDLLRGIRTAVRPSIEDVKKELRSELPQRGGLADWVGSAVIASRTRTSGRQVGVRVVGQIKGHDFRAIDRGRVRHPLFGNRRHWYQQSVKPGLVTETLRRDEKRVRKELVEVMDGIAKKIEKRS